MNADTASAIGRLDGYRLLIRSRRFGHGCASTQRKAERERIIRMG
jgi:hypothetical protein